MPWFKKQDAVYRVFVADSLVRKGSDFRRLPAWPLLCLLYGFPVIWILGLMQFAPTLLSGVMLAYLFFRRSTLVFGAFWWWLALIVWALLATVSLSFGTDLIAWGLRWINIVNVGIFALYYFNAHQSISPRRLLGGLAVIWVLMVVLGWCAIFFPDAAIKTPMSYVLPHSLTSNELVKAYVEPPLAEVQQPWGAPEAFNRPSAPFPYTNSWGLAYALLFPVICALWSMVVNRWFRLGILLVFLLSIGPALATSNRGMIIGLFLSLVMVLMRMLLLGRFKAAFFGFSTLALGGLVFVASGALATILDRQQYSDSTGGRAALYSATWEKVLASPLVGYGTPRMEVSVGVSMGTQGYLWSLLFCFGFVGLFCFLAFTVASFISNFSLISTASLWLSVLPAVVMVLMIFYSFDIVQLMILLLSIAVLARARHYGEVL